LSRETDDKASPKETGQILPVMFFAAVFAAVFALVFVVAAAAAVLDAGPLVLMSWLFKASWSVQWKKLRGSKITSQVLVFIYR